MTPLSTGEVLEALKRLQRWSDKVREDFGIPKTIQHEEEQQVLALLEKYAPEICSRAQKEAKGIREVRPVLTVEEARNLKEVLGRGPADTAPLYWRLDSALRDLDEPASLVEAKKEEDS